MITIEPARELTDGLDAWRAVGLSRAGLSGFVRRAQIAVGLRGEVDVLLAGDRTLRRLNREFRGKDEATDVLSFPAPKEFGGGHAGDLAISLETAGRQAKEQGHSLRDEVRVLLLHGLLHLAGMDHEVDGGEMAEREGALRGRLRLPRGLIARVEGGHTLGAKAPSSKRPMRPEAEASGYPNATFGHLRTKAGVRLGRSAAAGLSTAPLQKRKGSGRDDRSSAGRGRVAA